MTTHLEEYLRHYQALENPGYAVLVTGEWGSGKTHQIKQVIPDAQRYYVSLFGIQTVEQLHAEVFAVASPKLAKAASVVDRASDAATSIGGLFALAGATPSVFNAVFRRDIKPDRTLIFDDLERSDLRLKDVLGAINSYVEQHGFRVVVLAHDEKMTAKFGTMKEKTFGQTIKIVPQTDEAFENFLDQIKDQRTKRLVEENRNAILAAFHASEVRSLRILRHVIEDLDRLAMTLLDEHIQSREAMAELVPFFVALNIETRAGRLDRQALMNRQGVSMRYHIRAHGKTADQLPEKPMLLIADERYPNIELENNLISDDALCSMFVEGSYPVGAIRQSLNDSPHFLKTQNVAPWRVVINFDDLDDDIVQEAVVKMEQQIEERSATASGEILHIFALKLMMVEYGVQSGTMDEVVKQAIDYLDDLRNGGNLPPRTTDRRWMDPFDQAFEGRGYWVTEAAKPYFKRIWNHLIASRELAFEDQLPEILKSLLGMVRSDSKQFFEHVSHTNNGENLYALIPLLHHIPAEEFVATWLGSPNENWRNVYYAIENRYSHGRLNTDLSAEEDWAYDVYQALMRKVEEAEGFRAPRIRRVVPKVLIELANQRETE
ncbi:P-loop NTPase fold protein [Phaeobacter gallaeciensis]|nr:P-loop NTPase fold protein [Phaeobacter gallaeciensis]MDE4302871.1 P-loop NTPase fold protein [Phaeobacter gallaeciensis]MDE4307036.1 P-loop NTPase fold protein [Phaeobacter gallaeciensis]MDE4311501.1 P-loop NTPase fold protein [Phaeobacter gallaeciensis]MDE4316192.1 P-loop NTPase fold protein [Phaeobacter gallaeciensis]MDE4320428.1 P-loop NTPase fold protein [Phaeobacter gallaeciensis]